MPSVVCICWPLRRGAGDEGCAAFVFPAQARLLVEKPSPQIPLRRGEGDPSCLSAQVHAAPRGGRKPRPHGRAKQRNSASDRHQSCPPAIGMRFARSASTRLVFRVRAGFRRGLVAGSVLLARDLFGLFGRVGRMALLFGTEGRVGVRLRRHGSRLQRWQKTTAVGRTGFAWVFRREDCHKKGRPRGRPSSGRKRPSWAILFCKSCAGHFKRSGKDRCRSASRSKARRAIRKSAHPRRRLGEILPALMFEAAADDLGRARASLCLVRLRLLVLARPVLRGLRGRCRLGGGGLLFGRAQQRRRRRRHGLRTGEREQPAGHAAGIRRLGMG